MNELPTTHEVTATVVALVPEFNQVKLKDDAGNTLAVTRNTSGVVLDTLQVGQRLRCTVTIVLPRVLHATRLP